jgi:hypothetical protein
MEEKLDEHLEQMNREQSIQNANEPANPLANSAYYRDGLTKRETIAMHLCSAYISRGDSYGSSSRNAVNCADALLEELRKNKAK